MARLTLVLALQALIVLASAQSTTVTVSDGVSTTEVLPAWPSESYSSTTTTIETSVFLSGITTTTTTLFVPLLSSSFCLLTEIDLLQVQQQAHSAPSLPGDR